MRLSRLAPASLLCATPAWAHGGAAHDHGFSWLGEPLALGGLTLAAALYATGVSRCWRRAGRGRGFAGWQVGAFALGIAVLFVALITPIDHWADQLASVHMVQHLLLMMLGAPLLVLGGAGAAAWWALPSPARRRMAGWVRRRGPLRTVRYALWQPLLLSALYALVLWIWHLPALYEAALANELVHDLQHLCFLLAACLYWRVLLDPVSRFRISAPLATLYLFTTSLHALLLGLFMAFAQRHWYAPYGQTTAEWGLSPLEDQQIAGMLMWMPATMMYGLVAAAIFLRWLWRPPRQEPA